MVEECNKPRLNPPPMSNEEFTYNIKDYLNYTMRKKRALILDYLMLETQEDKEILMQFIKSNEEECYEKLNLFPARHHNATNLNLLDE